MSRVKCFLIEKTNKVQLYFRRYVSSDEEKCNSEYGYHDKSVKFKIVEYEGDDLDIKVEYDNSQFPTHCDCGYEFKETDRRQLFRDRIYKRVETGEELPLRDWEKTPGAIYNSNWYENFWFGPDKKCYTVILPNKTSWVIDSRASNCTLPDDKTHKCWVRHGEAPEFTVDKNGHTCSAGAGSILSRDYHGFLINGYLESC